MNKLVPFHKNIEFKTSIGDITSIALDKEIKINKDNIVGVFTISGSYKMLKTSTNQEEFSYDIPIDITMDKKYDLEKAKADIDDFHYEIVDDNCLDVSIDLLIDNIEEKKEEPIIIEEVIRPKEEIDIPFLKKKEELNQETEEILEVRNDKEDNVSKEDKRNKDISSDYETDNKTSTYIEESINESPKKSNNDKKVESLFTKFLDDEDTYSTYKVYIVRENDTLETIMEKYKVTKEELEDYNDLKDINLNDKIIIPCKNEKD
ncbi:MAG: LysM peptidoglycan-binding domain-containing protein [Bacilli bacterium]